MLGPSGKHRPKTAQRMRLLGRQLFWTKAGRNVRVLFGWHSPVSQKRPRLARDSLPARHFGTRRATELERPCANQQAARGLGNCHVPEVSLITVLMVMQGRPRRLEIDWH